MDNQLILIADGDTKNLGILKENLEASGFMVIISSNGRDAWEKIQRTPPKLILTETSLPDLSGYQLMEQIKNDPKTSSIPLIFLTKQREVQQRIRAFELGAKDYLVKPLHVKEVIAHIRMVLRRLEKRKIDQLETYKRFSGRLDQLSLADLIESFGVERKTGILTVSNGKKTGQVYFREGAVINAAISSFKFEQAVYQMFPWKSGYFNMIFRDVDIKEEISISNLGLLLQGIKRMEIRDKLISQLPTPDTGFTITPTFKTILQKKKIGDSANQFTQLLDGRRNINEIIDDSNLEDLIALKRLVRLYQQGFIKPTSLPKKEKVAAGHIIEPEKKVEYINQTEPAISKNEVVEAGLQTHDNNDADEKFIIKEKPIELIETELPLPEPPTEASANSEIPDKATDGEVIPSIQMRRDMVIKDDALETDDPFAVDLDTPQQENSETKEIVPKEEKDDDSEMSIIEQVIPRTNEESPESDAFFSGQPDKESKSEEDKTEVTKSPEISSIITDDNLEDFVFDLKPQNKHEDLENELKPLIESIENGKDSSPDVFKQQTDPTPKEAEKLFPTSETVESMDKIIPEQADLIQDTKEEKEETFIDEELIRQSTFVKENEKAAPQEPADENIKEKISQPETQEIKSTIKDDGRDRIVLISVDYDCKDELMDILTGDNFKEINLSETDNLKINVGKIASDKTENVKLLALSIESDFDKLLESIQDTIKGKIFTFDCTRPDTWEYSNYLIHSIYDKFKLPSVVSVMNMDEQDTLNLEVIRYKLKLPKEIPAIVWNESDESSKERLLDHLLN